MLIDAAPWRGGRALLLVILATALWGGCSPDDFLVADEDRERNFQRARDAERLGDFEAASEYYERALEKNSRAPTVHLGYASLCEGQLRRYADAVYHYQRYLRLRPEDPKAEDIRRRITNCTERLATSVPLVVRSETIARDLAAVRTENLGLRAQVTNLFIFSIQASNEVRRLSVALAQSQAQLQAYAQALAQAQAAAGSGQTAGGVGGVLGAGGGLSGSSGFTGGGVARGSSSRSPAAVRPGESATGGRTHRVRSGETMDRIARQYGVTLSALQRANPRIDARYMRSGMDLKIPPR
jgi:tetratricopeptide (TPR) repeat protein